MHGLNHHQQRRSKNTKRGLIARARELICDLRQLQYPPEFRIALPLSALGLADLDAAGQQMTPDPAQQTNSGHLDPSIAEVAVCLWDIRRKLEGNATAQEDRKLRLLNRRAEKAISSLEQAGVVIDDPIGRRYAPGSEGSMKPNFQPTPGTTYEKVIETIAPVIYRDDRLIGRGEVFVAVPMAAEAEPEQTEVTDASSESSCNTPPEPLIESDGVNADAGPANDRPADLLPLEPVQTPTADTNSFTEATERTQP